MKNKVLKNTLILMCASAFLAACVSNPANDEFTAEEIAPVEVQPAKALEPSAEINAIETQLASVEAQIQAAQARLDHYQFQNKTNPVTQSQITGTEAEISHYQAIKSTLMARKQELSTVR